MANTENTRQAARAALEVYRQQPGHAGNDDQESIADLIADLAHLADQLAIEYTRETHEWVGGGPEVLETASGNYYEETLR